VILEMEAPFHFLPTVLSWGAPSNTDCSPRSWWTAHSYQLSNIEYVVYKKNCTVVVNEEGFVQGFIKCSHSSFIWKDDVEVCRIEKIVMYSLLVTGEVA
jgi:hypothetical protein